MNIVTTFSVISGLASINRFSMVRLSRPESVLEHTGMVVLLCYLIHGQLPDRPWIDLGELLAKAAVHDVDELVTGDLPRPTKYSSPEVRAALAKMESKGVQKIANLLKNATIEAHYSFAKSDESGLIVSVADLMAAVYKIWDEVIMQNNHLMVRQAVHAQAYLHEKAQLLEALGTPLAVFLLTLVRQLQGIASEAAARDLPIHGLLREEIFQS